MSVMTNAEIFQENLFVEKLTQAHILVPVTIRSFFLKKKKNTVQTLPIQLNSLLTEKSSLAILIPN